jgi:2-C-methyl-D-erythritol 4-phosphate cytidylyltransferase
MNIAIILAGGVGSRLEKITTQNNSFINLSSIDEIAVVISEHYIFMVEDMIIKTNGKRSSVF